MKYVVLMKAKPYTRTRKGKLEHVKGYQRVFSPALEEATVWQIGKDYGLSKEEARKLYRDMFEEDRPKAIEKQRYSLDDIVRIQREQQSPKNIGRIIKEYSGKESAKKYGRLVAKRTAGERKRKAFDPVREHQEFERRMSGKFGPMKMVIAVRKPQIGDTVMWERRSPMADVPDKPMKVVGFHQGMVVIRDAKAAERGEYGGVDLHVLPEDVRVIPKEESPKDFAGKIGALRSLIEQQTKERFVKEYPKSAEAGIVPKVRVKAGDKYIKIDVGDAGSWSGKYMVERATGNIYGVKGYGVIHRGHYYGNLDTIGDYFWGGYTASKKAPAPDTYLKDPYAEHFRKKKKKTIADMPGRIPGYSLG